jgi:hypothetical protein
VENGIRAHYLNRKKYTFVKQFLRNLQGSLTNIYNSWEFKSDAFIQENGFDFFHLFSIMNLYSCLTDEFGNNTSRDMYGDSALIGGYLVVHLLKQNIKFQALDFCAHILFISEVETNRNILDEVRNYIVILIVKFLSKFLESCRMNASLFEFIDMIMESNLGV